MFDENKIYLFDGAMGTMIQKEGFKKIALPEIYNIKNPDLIYKIHKSYADAGTDFITTNTFGANRYKLFKSGFSPDDIISNAIKIAKKASSGQKIALDIGPIGKLMEPSGPLNFEEAYDIFKEEVISGVKNGADLIIIETISDIYEAKAAILAAKENSELPVICTMTFDSDGRTFTGTDIITMVNVIENLNVDALGVNCSLGPKEMLPNVKKILEYSSLPVIVQPNAGLPKMREGKTFYDITPCEFSKYVTEMIDYGVKIVGGCCGTDENYIKELKKNIKDLTPKKITVKSKTLVSSYSRTVDFDSGTVLIGERINPTGKKLLKAALKEENYDYIVTQAIKQHEEGAVILDVNNGMPGINEEISLVTSVKEIQKITDIPLQIDSSDINAIEKAVRIYNGKPIVNSVNGKKNNMEKIFPIVKKYGCCVIGLTLDEDGIPETAEKRTEIAGKIIKTAEEYGIDKKNIIIDCLVLTASAQQKNVYETLKAIEMIKNKYGVKTVLGISNVSYGLPERNSVNSTFFIMALDKGLDSAIINTGNIEIMNAYYSYNVLSGKDLNSEIFIKKFSGASDKKNNENISLKYLISNGLKDNIEEYTESELKIKSPMEIIENIISPVLEETGKKYEKNEIFLPQLIQISQTVNLVFNVLKKYMVKDNSSGKEKIILATVEGDIHDIGKNIVKVILENHGFEVTDLGKDVKAELILKTAKEKNIKLIGLSALMTTTVSSMENTISFLRKHMEGLTFIVGGAVLTEEYSKKIDADFYAKDAMSAAKILNEFKKANKI